MANQNMNINLGVESIETTFMGVTVKVGKAAISIEGAAEFSAEDIMSSAASFNICMKSAKDFCKEIMEEAPKLVAKINQLRFERIKFEDARENERQMAKEEKKEEKNFYDAIKDHLYEEEK